MSLQRKIRSLILISAGGFGAFAAISLYKADAKFYTKVVMPVVHVLDPEQAHKLGVIINKYRILPRSRYSDSELLKIKVFDMEFSNPVGIAAGYDKHGEAVMGLKDIGFGFVEVGSVTPQAQSGNEKPRLFRLFEDKAVINRYGFNSEGHEVVLQRLQMLKDRQQFGGIIGVNLGKNKNSPDPVDDYVEGIKKFGSVADYLVINISSPNTPGLRNLQNKETLRTLLKTLVETRNNLPVKRKPPLLLKLAPDLQYTERKDIAEILKRKDCRVDGLIISNTTIERPTSLKATDVVKEAGGLSGKPLKNESTQMIADMYKLTDGMTIIGVGGIFSGKDAYEKIKAGASLVQLYTALVFEGPPVVDKVKKELAQLLAEDGYSSLTEAIGKDIR